MPSFLLPLERISSLEDYRRAGGLAGLERAQHIGPAATIEEVLRSGLRGRGGGGYATGLKWRGIAAQDEGSRYVVCNAAEGEPGTFKDRALMRANPYQLVEGLVIAAFAVGARAAYICLKAKFAEERAAVERAVLEFQDAGVCADCALTIVAGPEEYLFGEEKAMLEVIEGNPPLPRWFPPHVHGLFATSMQTGWQAGVPMSPVRAANPTLVNNAETLSNVPHILREGVDWFRAMGTDESPGNVVATVVGDVVAPDVGEVELGTPLRDVISLVGSGVGSGRQVKAVFSGVANPVVTGEHLGAAVSYEGLAAVGSGMGSVGFIVYDDTACMVSVAAMFSRFLYVESCGQCPPCKLGSGEITASLERIDVGAGGDEDVEHVGYWLERVTDGNRCFLAQEEQLVVSSVLRAFPDEFAEHIELGQCPRPRELPMPAIVDLRDGVAAYDERFWAKRPDWTFND